MLVNAHMADCIKWYLNYGKVLIASQVFAQVRRQGTGSKGGKLGGSLSWLCNCPADWLHSFLIHKLRETSDSLTVLSILRELSEARTK